MFFCCKLNCELSPTKLFCRSSFETCSSASVRARPQKILSRTRRLPCVWMENGSYRFHKSKWPLKILSTTPTALRVFGSFSYLVQSQLRLILHGSGILDTKITLKLYKFQTYWKPPVNKTVVNCEHQKWKNRNTHKSTTL